MRFGIFRQVLDQAVALDDQIRLFERYGCRAAIGEQLESLYFVDDGALGQRAEQFAHSLRDDQGARRGIEPLRALENAHGAASTREKRSGVQTSRGTAHNGGR